MGRLGPATIATWPTRGNGAAHHRSGGRETSARCSPSAVLARDQRRADELAPTPTITAVIPTLNEARNLAHVLARIPPDVAELILVDGHSTDDTVKVARTLCPNIRVIQQDRQGKGNALACGFAHASGDIIVTLDADGSNDPAEIPRFVAALLAGADFAKGSRFIGRGAGSSDITSFRRYGNRWLNRITNVLYRTHYTDLCYGYNAFWRRCLPAFALHCYDSDELEPMRWGDGFEVETLVNVRAARAGLRVVEVPSFERTRIHGRSNLNAPLDGLRVLRTIAVERWRRPGPKTIHTPLLEIDLTDLDVVVPPR
jgi:glycosyltransferase involved in cell wall biosynthesis